MEKEGVSYEIRDEEAKLKRRISARTSIKRQIVHRAGLKMPRGWGWLRSPKKYAYNKVYRQTTFDVFSLFKKIFK